jgi:hypothetical protein
MVKAGFDIESLAGERIWIGMVGVFGRHVAVDRVLVSGYGFGYAKTMVWTVVRFASLRAAIPARRGQGHQSNGSTTLSQTVFFAPYGKAYKGIVPSARVDLARYCWKGRLVPMYNGGRIAHDELELLRMG